MDKLITASFIQEVQYLLRYIIPVKKKKNQGLHQLQDLNKACPEDDLHIPHMELVTDATIDYKALSFMEGYSGYNQIKMHPTTRK